MFNPFRKKIKVPEGVAFTPARSITQKYINAYVKSAETNIPHNPYEIHRKVGRMSDAEISEAAKDPSHLLDIIYPNGQVYTFPDSPQTLADAVPYLYYLHASHKLAEENKCQYCRSLFIADRRGNCRSCGAPK